MTAPRKTGKTGSRNPAKATTASAWKKSTLPPLMEMPSGNAMRIRKVGLQMLIKTGTVPNSLLGIAQKAAAKGQAPGSDAVTDQDMVDILQDQEKVTQIADFMDKVAILCAAEPIVLPIPDDGVERDEDSLYVDDLDEEDKMFIFQVVTGGTTDIEEFRKQLGANVAAVRGLEDVELPSE